MYEIHLTITNRITDDESGPKQTKMDERAMVFFLRSPNLNSHKLISKHDSVCIKNEGKQDLKNSRDEPSFLCFFVRLYSSSSFGGEDRYCPTMELRLRIYVRM